jgi:photosystem II stability/assembly factor-like uncharacterized protein
MRKKAVVVILLFGVLFFSLFQSEETYSSTKNSKNNLGINTELFSGLKFRCIGPSRGGRVTTVEGVTEEPGTFYMGAVGGGVWKTTDYGQSWKNISDGFFETGSIGDIQVADSDPNIIYVGTGSDGIRSNVIKGLGVYKSSDAGKTWEFAGLRNVGQIGAVEVHPTNPNIVFVAALGQAFGPNSERGVFRSKDGGKNWEKVLFLSDTTGAADLEFAPDDPNTIYASMWRAERKPWTIISGGLEGGVYKSIDGGDTWEKLGGGLPTEIIGKNDLAVSAADPNRVYVLYEALEDEGLYRSNDRGENFELVSNQKNLLDRPFYYCNLDADPSNADVLYVNTTGFFKSSDGGKTWQRRSTPHGDNHDMWINPNDPNLYIQSNDGGANVTRDGGETWSTQTNQFTAELYQIAVDDQFPYWIYAGQQDNSTIMVPSLPPYSPAIGPTGFWQAIGGCETGPAIPKPGNHNIVYANCKGRFGRYNKLTGQEKQYYVGASNMYGHNPKDLKYRFQRVSPIHVSPHDPNIVYHASQYLHKTTDEGVTWETISPDLTAFTPETQVISGSPITRDITGEEFYSTIYAIQESPLKIGLIWVGANDGPVHVTLDGGKNWKDVSPKDLPKGGRVQTVEPSPHQAGKAYFATYRYLLGDWQPYIYRTNDYGKTWKRLTTGKNGIPNDYPTRTVREDPDREGLLYAGTEFGMFISFDDGENWQKFQLNLPITPITDIKVFRKDLIISTMGRSFWIMDNVTPLHQMSDEISNSDYHIFQPNDAYRLRHRASREPEYPAPGAVIDYFINEEPENEIKLEISNSTGKTIRTFISRNRPQQNNQQQRGRRGFAGSNLEKSKGMHRFNWDMRHDGPVNARTGRSRGAGPMVSPGNYQAKLTIGNWSQTVSLNLLTDPRVENDGVTQDVLLEQEKLCLRVQGLLEDARKAQDKINQARKELKEKVDSKNKNAIKKDDQLKKLESKFVTNNTIRYPTPMLVDQISYLNSMLNRADQKPGKDAYDRFEELSDLLNNYSVELDKILK